MPVQKCKLITLCIIGTLNVLLFLVSLNVDYQWMLAEEHIRFRSGFPSQANWITSPYGKLSSYLFNVTNAEAFLNGTDTKMKVQEVGPISYRITGRNEVLHQNESSLTYRKIRYFETEFDAEASCSPDILNQTIILPNLLLLGAAAKLHDWVFLVRHAFNAITINEPVFINQTVNYFLWEFKTPALNLLSNYVPDIVANCGMLHNALRKKEEVYNVNIGVKNGIENFFRVNSLNNLTYFPEQSARTKFLKNKSSNYCPIEVLDSFDNSLFSPFVKAEKDITIVAGESCRTHRLTFRKNVNHLGLKGYQYVVDDLNTTPNCLDNAMGIKLHKGMFDVSKCLFNDVPSAFSSPHFYGSSYNWSEHYEGFTPNREDHETSIIIEPTTGIPIEENYRFQSNIPMPDMTGYNKDLQRFSNIVVPSFWYEYDLDDLPSIVLLLMRFNIIVIPVLQPILIVCSAFISIYCFISVYLTLKGIKLKNVLEKSFTRMGCRKMFQNKFYNNTSLTKKAIETNTYIN